MSPVVLVGQAPGDKEPKLGRPFAWTAGRTLFRWFDEGAGVSEELFRTRIYMAAVCRCFPGKKPTGGDRVPDRTEIATCGRWLSAELGILAPRLVLPVGKLAIEQFVPYTCLEELIGKKLRAERDGHVFDVIPLPHPSGASPWPRMEPGRTLVAKALRLIARHEAFREATRTGPEPSGRAARKGLEPSARSARKGPEPSARSAPAAPRRKRPSPRSAASGER